jgi:phage terminase large subunit
MPITTKTGVEKFIEDSAAPKLLDGSARIWQRKLCYYPFPKQQRFHYSGAKYRLFGGAAGPGKSKALMMEAIVRANEHPGVNTLLLRRTFPELEASLLQYFRRDIPRELYRSYNDSKHVVTWFNESTTQFGYSRSESDIYQYQGAEYLFIGIDELTMFTLAQWQFLTSRNRCPVSGARPNMAGATNPGNIGHAWVKSLWIDKQAAAGMDSPGKYDPGDYDFIPARLCDNPIYAADVNYLKSLDALPENLRRAFLEGDWTVFAGQYFDNFNTALHVSRPEEIQFEPWWARWISIDWGFEHPAAVYWHTAAPRVGESAGGELGVGAAACRTVTYREFTGQHMSPRELAAAILDHSVDEKISAVYLSPDAFARHTDHETIADQIGNMFVAFGLPRPVPADNDRVGGWMLMYQMLEAEEWLITSNCVELIRTLPNLVRDNVRVEDIAKIDGDDSADAARYGLKSRHSRVAAGDAPYEQRLAARVTSGDPTIRAIQARKAQLAEHDHSSPIHFARRQR